MSTAKITFADGASATVPQVESARYDRASGRATLELGEVAGLSVAADLPPPPPIDPPLDPPPVVPPPVIIPPVVNVPSGAFPPEGAEVHVIDLGTGPDAVYAANEKAKTFPPESWVVIEGAGTIKVGNTAQVLTRAKTVLRSKEGGRLAFDCSTMGSWWGGKAGLILYQTEQVVENVDFYKARANVNSAGLWIERAGSYVIRGVRAWHCGNGIMSANDLGIAVLMEQTETWDNGDGGLDKGHNVYLGCGKVEARNVKSYYTTNPYGGVHALKFRSSEALIVGGEMTAGRGACIDIPYGGKVTIRDATLIRPDGEAGNILMVGAEDYNGQFCRRGDGPTLVENVTVINHRFAGAMRNYCSTPGQIVGGSIPASVTLQGFARQ